MADLGEARDRMVQRQIVGRGIASDTVVSAFRRVPREAFVPENLREFAYEDSPLPIEAGQTISQPYIVALMIDAAEIGPEDRVLEIGCGSGYAAAVMSRIAKRVYTIERHDQLARLARKRVAGLGYDNVEIRTGDGTRGWPEAAPFDAILAAAGGPAVPAALTRQLSLGGRLVMPVGDDLQSQRLVKITRRSETEFDEEDLGPVMFVPLIGEHGWSEDEASRTPPRRTARPLLTRDPREEPLPLAIKAAAEPLPDFDNPAFAAAFDRFAGARVVLLGEASHGTSEFYKARAAITRRLVEQHGFNIVALEADWPDAASIDRYARHRPAPAHAEPAFPDLDVAQHRVRGLRRVAPCAQRRPARRAAGRRLRPRPL